MVDDAGSGKDCCRESLATAISENTSRLLRTNDAGDGAPDDGPLVSTAAGLTAQTRFHWLDLLQRIPMNPRLWPRCACADTKAS